MHVLFDLLTHTFFFFFVSQLFIPLMQIRVFGEIDAKQIYCMFLTLTVALILEAAVE